MAMAGGTNFRSLRLLNRPDHPSPYSDRPVPCQKARCYALGGGLFFSLCRLLPNRLGHGVHVRSRRWLVSFCQATGNDCQPFTRHLTKQAKKLWTQTVAAPCSNLMERQQSKHRSFSCCISGESDRWRVEPPPVSCRRYPGDWPQHGPTGMLTSGQCVWECKTWKRTRCRQ